MFSRSKVKIKNKKKQLGVWGKVACSFWDWRPCVFGSSILNDRNINNEIKTEKLHYWNLDHLNVFNSIQQSMLSKLLQLMSLHTRFARPHSKETSVVREQKKPYIFYDNLTYFFCVSLKWRKSGNELIYENKAGKATIFKRLNCRWT